MVSINTNHLTRFLDHMEAPEFIGELAKMTTAQREYLLDIILESAEFGWSDTYTQMVKVDWDIEPASPRQFFTDPYYKGPDATIYPLLVDYLDDALNDPLIYEIIMTGAIGYGKSFCCGYGIAYEVHRLLCMRNPQGYAGISKGTKLSFINMSVSADNADSVLYSYIFNAIEKSPWFQDHFPIDERSGLYWPEKNIEIRSGSSSEVAVIGSNLVGSAMDEANFMANAKRSKRAIMAGEKDVAFSIYNQITKRRVSRFLKSLKGDRIPPARMWLLSSKQFPGDFLENRIKTINDLAQGGEMVNSYVIDCDQWTPKMSLDRLVQRTTPDPLPPQEATEVIEETSEPPANKHHDDNPYTSGLWFPVMIGDAMNASSILSEDTFNSREECVAAFAMMVPDGCEIVPVPWELQLKFKEDLPNAIRDLCGKSIHSLRPYIHDPEGVKAMVCNKDLGDVDRVHPYQFIEYHILSPELVMIDKLPIEQLANMVRPLLNPDAPRVGHCDLALNHQSAGLAVQHCPGYKQIRQRIPKQVMIDGRLCTRFVDVIEQRPIIITDFLMRIVPPDGGEINIKSFRLFFYALERLMGFKYSHSIENAISYDQFQSGESIQEMREAGYAAGRFSVDRNPEAYAQVKSAIRDKRFSCYKYLPLIEDLSSLERDPKNGKIKKGQGRTHGDVSDCVAANTFKLEGIYNRIQIPLIHDSGNDNYLLDDPRKTLAKVVQPGHVTSQEAQRILDEAQTESEVDVIELADMMGGGGDWYD